ncbi:hypothetical protein ACHAWF_004232 [Thalassiosira exigua]
MVSQKQKQKRTRMGIAVTNGGDASDEDCRSVRSLPLLKDDDYFYYRSGEAGDDDEGEGEEEDAPTAPTGPSQGDPSSAEAEDERVDHVGALIRPRAVPSFHHNHNRLLHEVMKVAGGRPGQLHPPKLSTSLQSDAASEVTCDWSVDSVEDDDDAGARDRCGRPRQGQDEDKDHPYYDRSRGGRRHGGHAADDVSIEDFIGLKLRVAELETQLQRHASHGSRDLGAPDATWDLIEALKEEKLSMECENIGLKQKLKQAAQNKPDLDNSDRAAREKTSALQAEVDRLKRKNESLLHKNESLQEENRRLRKQQERQRQRQNEMRSSGSSKSPDGFPQQRRCTTGALDSPYSSDSDEGGEGPVNYVPFPKCSRRHSMEGYLEGGKKTTDRPPEALSRRNSSYNSNYDSRRPSRRPSLLTVLRSSFDKKPGKLAMEQSETSRTTTTTRTTQSTLETSTKSKLGASYDKLDPGLDSPSFLEKAPEEDEKSTHEPWVDEINAQTEIFNHRAEERMRERARAQALAKAVEREADEEETPTSSGGASPVVVSSRSDGDDPNSKHAKRPVPRRARSERDGFSRRRSFSLDKFKSFSLRKLASEEIVEEEEEEFDPSSMLWDGEDDEGGMSDDRTVETRQSFATAVF